MHKTYNYRGEKMKKLLIMSLALSLNTLAAEPKEDPSAVPAPGVPFSINAPADAFGYTVSDSSGTMCNSQFIDISATGAFVFDGDDASSGPIALTGAFDFYGTTLTDIVMASNGYLSTDPTDTGPDLSNDCPLPATPSTGGGARIYPLHDDLDLQPGIGRGLFQYFPVCPRPSDQFPTANLGCHVFQWDEVEHWPGGTAANAFDVEVILYDDSYEIVFQHDGRNPEAGSGSTTGIQDSTATIAEMYSCNTAASIPANSAQCFVHPNPNVLAAALPVPANNKFTLIVLFLSLFAAGFFFFRRKT